MSWMSPRGWTDGLQHDFSRHLEALRREVQAMGGTAKHGAGELGEALLHSGAIAARQLGRQAKRTGAAIQRDPVPVLVGAIAVACLASLFVGRKK